jgi:site-specific DNA-methyltransferase (adenine-specific)
MTAPMLFLDGRIELLAGDCLDVLKTLPENSIDSCVTDPPYALVSIVKRFGKPDSAPCKEGKTGAYARASRGFMGKQWDTGERAFTEELWAEVLRVLKPGGHVLAFGGTRTVHRLTCAIEDAGFEIRDSLCWLYGVGFPKSHNLSGSWEGWGTALKPGHEQIVLARKPLSEKSIAANVLRWRTGALNIDSCRIPSDEMITNHSRGSEAAVSKGIYGDSTAQETHQTAGQALGRWPANLILDGSDEVIGAFPTTVPSKANDRGLRPSGQHGGYAGAEPNINLNSGGVRGHSDSGGSAARFFYSAKADTDDRLGSKHPTVKPVDLMQYLVRLVTPKGGVVLDCFAGTGTTGEAAYREGMRAVLIEKEPEYLKDIERRMGLVLAGPEERAREILKARGLANEDAGPLFEGLA